MILGLNVFFNRGHPNFNPNVVHLFIKRVKDIRRWFEQQREFAFYSSSILFVYDAAVLMKGADETVDCSMFADACMIDFAHVFPSHERDNNYISGLDGVLRYFHSILDQEP
jgi:hypothetical protein